MFFGQAKYSNQFAANPKKTIDQNSNCMSQPIQKTIQNCFSKHSKSRDKSFWETWRHSKFQSVAVPFTPVQPFCLAENSRFSNTLPNKNVGKHQFGSKIPKTLPCSPFLQLKQIFAHFFGHCFAVIFCTLRTPQKMTKTPAVHPIRRGPAPSSTASPPCSSGASRSARSTLAFWDEVLGIPMVEYNGI